MGGVFVRGANKALYAVYVKIQLLPAAMLTLGLLVPALRHCQSQEMHESVAKPSASLQLRGLDGTELTVSPADLKALPHKTIHVFNAHLKRQESYSCVPLADLLSKVHVPLGGGLKGKLFATAVTAEGTDGYRVVYSLAEVDPAMHNGDVLVADVVDGEALTKNGAFQLINTEDKRPARWVRNLDRIVVESVDAR